MADAILAGDVGGTKSHLGLYRRDGHSLMLVRDEIYRTPEFNSVEEIAVRFLGSNHGVRAACFGVPGLVIRGRSQATNIPWTMDEALIARALGGTPTRIVNDLVATGYGVIHLASSDLAVLQRGTLDADGFNIAVIAAGTGLGEAALVAQGGGRFIAVASEGGHSDFAPRGPEQIALLSHLAREFDHVSVERVCSGPGLFNIYRFMRQTGADGEPAWLTAQLNGDDPPAAISEAALAGRDPVCVRALAMFVDIYAAEAANLVLKYRALGGVYLGGGIAPKILPALQDGRFLRSFRDKGRMSEVLAKIDVKVSLNPAAALSGAAHLAAELI
jgi:glucokinase